MKLTKEEIKYIDSFLKKKKIKYLDIRVELLDHLATDFEDNSSYSFIDDYLLSEEVFIKNFAKKQQRTIHWSYQKQLWVQFANFFYKPKFLLLLMGLIVLGYSMLVFFSLKTFSFIWFAALALLILYPLYYQTKYAKVVKKIQSMQSLFTITALPSIFLYVFGRLKDILFSTPLFLIGFCAISFLLGLSAVIIIEKERKKVLEKYHQLVF